MLTPELYAFVHLMFMGIIALFPVVNPIGTAFIVMPYFDHLSDAHKQSAVRKITIYAFGVCVVALFAGQWILDLFGISIPVVRMAGGVMICKMGWEFLTKDKEASPSDESSLDSDAGYRQVEKQLFYPITFPTTTGAGTISVLFTLSAHGTAQSFRAYVVNQGAILLAIVVICVLVYVFYSNTRLFVRFLGSEGEKIFNRITAFLIFCVGLQIATTGIKAVFTTDAGVKITPKAAPAQAAAPPNEAPAGER